MAFRAAVVACMIFIAAAWSIFPASAQSEPGWNGTWIGNWETGQGTQIVFAGNDFISIYWDGDYVPDAVGQLSKDGKVVTITWQAGRAVLTRKSAAAVDIVIHEKGKKDVSFALKRDS